MTIGLAQNQSQPHTTVNQMVHGYFEKDVAGGVDVTLTDFEATYMTIEFTGALTANIDVFAADAANFFCIYNNTSGAFTLTFGPTAGTGVTITQGNRVIIVFDGSGNSIKWTTEV